MKKAASKPENDYFTKHVLPRLEATTEEMDAIDLKMLKKRWSQFEAVPGIQKLITDGDNESVATIFDLATSL